jgi:molybdopterin converting factor small subunit
MKVNFKCFGNLAKKYDCEYNETTVIELTEGEKVSKIMDAFGITEAEAKIVFVNHRISGSNQSLKDGDRVSLAPATGGM